MLNSASEAGTTSTAGVPAPTAWAPGWQPARRPRTVARGLLKAVRPKQWVKNVLVVAAPASAGVLLEPSVLGRTAVALVAFTACAAAGYLVNDAGDVAADRRHPTKRYRPIAAGIVPVGLARAAALVLAATAVGAGGLLCGWELSASLVVYLAVTFTYSTWLKHIAILEMLMVAAGFLLRTVTGAAATHVTLSRWFLIVAGFGSLYMVVGKRYAEATGLGENAAGARRILAEYPLNFLRQTRELSAGVTLVAYCLWAFERAPAQGFSWGQLSILPMTFGLLRYGLLLERGQGGAPEDVVLGDRPLLVAGSVWVVTFGLGVLATRL